MQKSFISILLSGEHEKKSQHFFVSFLDTLHVDIHVNMAVKSGVIFNKNEKWIWLEKFINDKIWTESNKKSDMLELTVCVCVWDFTFAHIAGVAIRSVISFHVTMLCVRMSDVYENAKRN